MIRITPAGGVMWKREIEDQMGQGELKWIVTADAEKARIFAEPTRAVRDAGSR